MRLDPFHSILAPLRLRQTEYRLKLNISILLGYPLIPPRFASIIVTERCNSRCRYCDYWRKSHGFDLSLDAYTALCRELQALGTKEVVLSGGEPLMRKDIANLVAVARANGMARIGLITNGLLLTTDLARQLVSAGLSWLELSLDSLDEEVYALQRGIPFHSISQGLAALIDMKQAYPKMGASIHCVISKLNLQGIRELVDLAKQNHLAVGFQPYHRSTFGNAEDDLSRFDLADTAELASLCAYLKERRPEGFIVSSGAYLSGITSFVTSGHMPRFKCLTGFLHVVIDGEGNVRPCWSLPPVGYLSDPHSLRDIWFSPAFRQTRLAMVKLRCPGCWLNCHIEPSLPFQHLAGSLT